MLRSLPLILIVLAARAAQAVTPTNNIIVDQFGWRANATKVLVVANPQSGQNAPNVITPGSTIEIRRSSDNVAVITVALTIWNAGATHADSGDKAWQADFSALTTVGSYYAYEPSSARSSYVFEIRDDAYNAPLQAVVKGYFYQRCGITITAGNGGNWNHLICHVKSNQDLTAHLWNVTDQGAGTARDVSGGWHDAGDYNKYVEFLTGSVWHLLHAWEVYPDRFGDATNIPESGNGVPDILDEVKWELDWLLKMQNSNGSVADRTGVTSFASASPPNNDTVSRYYSTPSSWATASFAAYTAYGARIFANFSAQYPGYSAALQAAAENAWAWLLANPSPLQWVSTGLVNVNTNTDTGDEAGRRVWAAAELYKTTGNATYKTYFDANYNVPQNSGHNPISDNYFDTTLSFPLQMGMLTYATTAGATAGIVTQIKTSLRNGIEWNFTSATNQAADPYKGFMWSGHYCWGSNSLKGNWGMLPLWGLQLNVNAGQAATYRRVAEEYLHYFHGRNPLSWTYITGMLPYGADKCPTQIYHAWLGDGFPLYDGASSTYGPAPGIIPGGANQYYTGGIAPPSGEPAMKAYKDWNTGWPEDSWEVTENSQGYSGPYVFLCAAFANPVVYYSPTPTPSYTASRTATATRSATPTFSASPTPSGPSATPSATPTASHSASPSPSPSSTATLANSATVSPTFTDVPSGSSPTDTPQSTATPTNTMMETYTTSPTPIVASPTATATVTDTPSAPANTATATETAVASGPGSAGGQVIDAHAVPNPAWGSAVLLGVKLDAAAPKIRVSIYSSGHTLVWKNSFESGYAAGWNSLALPPLSLASGSYYLVVDSGSAPKKVVKAFIYR